MPNEASSIKETAEKVPPTDISVKDDSDFSSNKHSKEKYKQSNKNHKKYSKSALPCDKEFPSLFDRYESDTDNPEHKEKARKRFRECPIKSSDNPPSI